MVNLIGNVDYKKTALISPTQKVVYGELIEEINKLKKVFPKNEVVIILCSNSVDIICIYLACLKCGTIPILLSPNITTKSLQNYIKTYKPLYIVSKNEIIDLNLKKTKIKSSFLYHGLSSSFIDSNKIAMLLTTSGSTGNPKLVKISKDNILSNTISICKYLKIQPSDRHITTLPMHYTYGLSCINTYLFSGATIILNDYSITERKFWDFVKKTNPTSLAGVPYTYTTLLRLGINLIADNNFRVLTQAGGKLDNESLLKYSDFCDKNDIRFFVMYGQTEATARMSYLPPHKLKDKIGSIGIAIPDGEFEIRDQDNGNIINSINTTGELFYKGNNVSLGYANNFFDLSINNQDKYILKTSDLAYKDEEGYFYVIGRLSRFAKINGLRISLSDLEEFILRYKVNAAVISDDKDIYIFIEKEKYTEEISTDIRKSIISEFSITPSVLKVKNIKKIPRSESGKIDYLTLKKSLND